MSGPAARTTGATAMLCWHDQWEAIQALFHQSCDLAPEERAALLESLPPDQRDALGRLLQHDTRDRESPFEDATHRALNLLAPSRRDSAPET